MTVDSDVVYVTEEGLQKIKDELEYLKTEKREEISAKLAAAVRQGDLKENADYHERAAGPDMPGMALPSQPDGDQDRRLA